MRRTDREIKDRYEIIHVMEGCDVCRLAINDPEGWPYIVPLNFGMEADGERLTLYFHSALEGKKLRLLANDNRVCFEMDRGHRLVTEEETGNCTMEYESVIGRGLVTMVPEEEKLRALGILMAHYRQEGFPFNHAVVPRTAVYKLTVQEVTGKRRAKKAKA